LFREGFNSTQVMNQPAVKGLDLVQRYGVGVGTSLGELKKGDVVLIVAGDVEEAAPVHMLRLKAAADRGVKLIVANARKTKMDRYAAISIRYQPGAEVAAVYGLLNEVDQGSAIKVQVTQFASSDEQIKAAGKLIAEAQNFIVMFGDERQANDAELAQACANLVVVTGHIGKANNGLLPLWLHNNTQGVFDMLSAQGLAQTDTDAQALYIVATDPIGDGQQLPAAQFVVVQELFLTETAQQADVVLPALSWAERDGTFTNGERRVQRYYKALPPLAQVCADWEIFRAIAEKIDLAWKFYSAEGVMENLVAEVSAYAGLTYAKLGETKEEWPPVGTSNDLYFGGTAYDNRGGVGAQAKSLFEVDGRSGVEWIEPATASHNPIVPRLLNRPGTLIDQSAVYEVRLREAELVEAGA
jgi:NADH-quinone oxidoreductase subunit G